jgi:hypothetical protein
MHQHESSATVPAGATDDRCGRSRPWLLEITLPLVLAAEDGFTEVEERLCPRLALERQLDALPPASVKRSSCESSTSCRTNNSPLVSTFNPQRHVCGSHAPFGASPVPLFMSPLVAPP